MAGSIRGVIGGSAVLAVVLFALAGPSSVAGAEKEAKPQDAAPALKPELAVDLGGGVKMELVLIRPGSFDMGSDMFPCEKPVHKVTIEKAFYIGKYEVTQEQWQAVMGANPSHFRGPTRPVESVSWNACRDFVAKLSAKTGRKFSLPSEAEWEYACRAGSTTVYCFGDGQAGLGEYAWSSANANNMTHPVGQKKPNKWGIFDMHGNVGEWCEDVLHGSYEGAPTDGSAWVEEGHERFRITRGASCLTNPLLCHSAFRFGYSPSYMCDVDGCRVILREF